MENPTYIALSRLDSQQRAMDVVASNIANANTDGYKAQRVLFSDFLSRQRDVDAPSGSRELAYVQDRATYLDHADGALKQTGNPLDLAITGSGYFTVASANGPRLTRSGRFSLLPDGRIADPSGNLLLDTGGAPLQVAPTDTKIHVAGDGTISSENGPIGKVGIVTVNDPNMLVPEGGTLYRSGSDTTADPSPKIVQGAVEASNVQPITELTKMIRTQQEFQIVSQFVEDEGQRQQSAIDKLTQQQS